MMMLLVMDKLELLELIHVEIYQFDPELNKLMGHAWLKEIEMTLMFFEFLEEKVNT